ncbi:hypothetical protein BDQ12DRAFT_89890 [Crucibulum laeve]|uniref:Uncharacterized protein n=1 Tax=Crucibulum laeve TaxID=68775 RepID=A0A5C3M2M5_9AGAR|nr:hypothetical protein BDQ12DRAFT_89890 [Crucibulum laeve]
MFSIQATRLNLQRCRSTQFGLVRHCTGLQLIAFATYGSQKRDFTKPGYQSISDTTLETIQYSAKREANVRIITTFDPKKLQPPDFFDISEERYPSFYTREYGNHQPALPITYHSEKGKYQEFPRDAGGFFYYHRPPGLPEIAGEIRFRTTGGRDMFSFEKGKDLLRPPGIPWRIPLLLMAGADAYTPFRTRLLEDGLVSEKTMEICKQIYLGGKFSRGSTFVFDLSQPFVVDFSKQSSTFWVIGHEKSGLCKLNHIFGDSRSARKVFPYNGAGMVRLERSTLPEHAGTHTLVMRVLQIVQPVQCTVKDYDEKVQRPTEGELVTRTYKNVVRPWSVRLDGKEYSSFKALLLLLPEKSSKSPQHK